jgi:hypothetical protein
MTSKEQKACPFCGGEAIVLNPHPHSFVPRCSLCSATSGWCPSEDEAVVKWNRRVSK